MTASALDFGTYNPVGGSTIDAATTISVTCGAIIVGATISYEITLSTGNSGSYAGRQLSNGSDVLIYNLYTDSGRTTVWGDGTGGTATVTNGYLLSLLVSRTDNFDLYGRLPSGQNVSAGSYSDTITAMVIF